MRLVRRIADTSPARAWILGVLSVTAALVVFIAAALDQPDDAALVGKHPSPGATTASPEKAFDWLSDPSLPRASEAFGDAASAPWTARAPI